VVAAAAASSFARLGSTQLRAAWEVSFDTRHATRYLNAAAPDLAAAVEGAGRRFGEGEGDEGGAFAAELAEAFDPTALLPAERAGSGLGLWLFRRPFDLSHFATALQRLSAAGESPFPALAVFVEREPKLRGLAHLPKCLEWVRLLAGRFNRKLDRDTARSTTIGEVLDMVPAAERDEWEAAFNGFEAAWNANFQFAERFECREIPALFKGMVMSRGEMVSFCLPSEQDEGICPLVLIQHLVGEHNAVAFAVDERMLTGGRGRAAAHEDARGRSNSSVSGSSSSAWGSNQRLVNSRHMSAAHAVRYDLEGGAAAVLGQAVRDEQCVTSSA